MEIKLNLLPEEKKKEIRRSKRLKFVVWQGTICVFLIVFFGCILFSIYYMLSFQLKDLKMAADLELQQSVFQEVSSAERLFEETNAATKDLKALQREHVVWTRFFDEINTILTNKIVIEKIITKNYTISLSGIAETRDDLLRFQSQLNESSCFQNANIPLSDLFSQKNTQFQLDVEIKKECLKPQDI